MQDFYYDECKMKDWGWSDALIGLGVIANILVGSKVLGFIAERSVPVWGIVVVLVIMLHRGVQKESDLFDELIHEGVAHTNIVLMALIMLVGIVCGLSMDFVPGDRIPRLVLRSWIAIGYSERWIARGCLLALIGIVASLLLDQQGNAEYLSILLYYGLVITTIAGLLPDRPRKREKKLSHLLPNTRHITTSRYHLRDHPSQDTGRRSVVYAREAMILWIVATVVAFTFVVTYLNRGGIWQSGYWTWIVWSAIGFILYILLPTYQKHIRSQKTKKTKT